MSKANKSMAENQLSGPQIGRIVLWYSGSSNPVVPAMISAVSNGAVTALASLSAGVWTNYSFASLRLVDDGKSIVELPIRDYRALRNSAPGPGLRTLVHEDWAVLVLGERCRFRHLALARLQPLMNGR